MTSAGDIPFLLDQFCPIWGTAAMVRHVPEGSYTHQVVDSPRAAGRYIIEEPAAIQLRSPSSPLSETEKAKLTTMLVNQRMVGILTPRVAFGLLDEAKAKEPLPVYERAERLLGELVNRPHKAGDFTPTLFNDVRALAVSESTDYKEVQYFLDYLKDRNWVTINNANEIKINVAGYARVQEMQANQDSSQAFVAMWINEKVEAAYEEGIVPAIREAGYTGCRIDKKPDVHKIDDAIIAEIRRSRFMVADFTYGLDGIRGSVYYEAGFAHGLGIPVIYSCRRDQIKKLHFDIRQYYHIAWGKPEDLRSELTKRILAIVGEGPSVSKI